MIIVITAIQLEVAVRITTSQKERPQTRSDLCHRRNIINADVFFSRYMTVLIIGKS